MIEEIGAQTSGWPSQQSVNRNATSARIPWRSAQYRIDRPSPLPRTRAGGARIARWDDSVLLGQVIVAGIAAAAKPLGAQRTNSRNISRRVCCPSAAKAASACADERLPPEEGAGPTCP